MISLLSHPCCHSLGLPSSQELDPFSGEGGEARPPGMPPDPSVTSRSRAPSSHGPRVRSLSKSDMLASWSSSVQDCRWGPSQTPVLSPGSHPEEGSVVRVRREGRTP